MQEAYHLTCLLDEVYLQLLEVLSNDGTQEEEGVHSAYWRVMQHDGGGRTVLFLESTTISTVFEIAELQTVLVSPNYQMINVKPVGRPPCSLEMSPMRMTSSPNFRSCTDW